MTLNNDIQKELDRIIKSDHHDPFHILGFHLADDAAGTAVVRTFQPHAKSVYLVTAGNRSEMGKIREEGVFERVIPNCSKLFEYSYEVTYHDGAVHSLIDPYRFLPQLGDLDKHLFNNGTHYELYDKLGAHQQVIDNIDGTIFRVWAPAARSVSLLGNFNSWDNRVHQMRVLGSSGIWELFVPGIGQGEPYKFEICGQQMEIMQKSDPFQFFAEIRPKTASIVCKLDDYQWQDDQWLAARKKQPLHEQPISVYEVHLGSWRRDPADPLRFLTYKELARDLIPYVKEMGFTHIELMPIMEHPLDESWGYQVTGYYAPTSRHGTPQEFMYFVDQCHQHNIGVILDWVPCHFPTDGHGLCRFDGTALYEHEDPRQGAHPEWGTLIFNYGRKEVSNFLIANALFWLDKYHLDGLRVDAVASMLYLDYARPAGQWIPNQTGGKENIEAIEFLKHLNTILYERFPGIMTIAEESTSFFGVSKPTNLGGLGFGFKWNMGWMNDMLDYFRRQPIFRKYHHNALTFSLLYAFSENFILPLSHDEVVHGKRSLLNKMPGDKWQQFANLRLLFFLQWTHPGKKILFMGGEFAHLSEWYSQVSLDWHLLTEGILHQQTQHCVKQLNKLYIKNKALWEIDFRGEGFKWLDFKDVDNSIIAFVRFAKNRRDHVVCLLNFTPQVFHDYKLGVMELGSYRQIFNSDLAEFGGSNINNDNCKEAIDEPSGDALYHIKVSVPPLSGIIFQPVKLKGETVC